MAAVETDSTAVPAPTATKSLVAAAGQELAPAEASGQAGRLLKIWQEWSWGRRLGVLALLALTLALGVAVVLWAGAPEYKPLFVDLSEDQAGEIVEALDKLQADYKIDRKTGTLLAPADKVHELRLRLAAQGLPKRNEAGYEILAKEPGLGVSRALEQARYQHALEGELARSIMTLEGVKAARVHLALPKESVFVRQRKPPSASVVLQLAPGHEIRREQVQAIVHLVASSVPRLTPDKVTVVDQYGHLLNAVDQDKDELALTDKQFEYKKKVEEHLVERIETLLAPLVGRDALRTQVTADIDFTAVERTEELYNPDLPALRSEQQEHKEARQEAAAGVPGALTNQPPAAGTAPEVAPKGQENAASKPLESQQKLVRNYELDRVVSHVRQAVGAVRRLTVAVAVDDIKQPQADGTVLTRPYTQEELNNLTALVKQAVGYDASRGDQVVVTNVAFRGNEESAPAPLPLWQQPWVWTLGKQLVALVAVLVLSFAVLRPLLRALLPPPPPAPASEAQVLPEEEGATVAKLEQELTPEQESEELLRLTGPQSYEKRLEFVHRLIDQDPDRVAQVVKNWILEDGRR
ncbi:flagellar basal-body MS-ring/collar protein FliF [Methylothermus subterraneus]